MKNIRRYLGAIGLLLLLGVVTSCIKDDIATTSDADAVNITVNVGSRAAEVDEDNSEVLANEGIKTIRLILVQNGKVVSNSKHSFTSPDGQELLEQGIWILGLKKAATDFYAVVNEASVNVVYDNMKIGTDFDVNVFSQAQLVPYSEFKPEENRLPMVGSKSVSDIEDNATISIDVTRAVARIDLTINNETGSALKVNQVNFGKFFPDKGFLLGTPESEQISYSVKSFSEDNTTIAIDGSQLFSYYLYESLHGEAYTVGMTGSNDYDLAPIVDKTTHQTISSLPRNTILKVSATANPTGWELFCNVLPWTKNDVQVDFRDNLSYFSNGWDKNTILPTSEGNLVHIDPLKEAVLTFTIETPNTATWKAQIVPNSPEDINVFEFVGENSGSIYYDESGKARSQQLKVRISKDYQESQVEHSATLKVFAEIAGKEYELDLTNTSGQPQEPDEGQSVSRYTLLQKK